MAVYDGQSSHKWRKHFKHATFGSTEGCLVCDSLNMWLPRKFLGKYKQKGHILRVRTCYLKMLMHIKRKTDYANLKYSIWDWQRETALYLPNKIGLFDKTGLKRYIKKYKRY